MVCRLAHGIVSVRAFPKISAWDSSIHRFDNYSVLDSRDNPADKEIF